MSSRVFVRFAALTGNVTYLFRAIDLLLSEGSVGLGNEIHCDALESVPRTASYVVTKYEEHVLMRSNLPSDTVLLIEEEFLCFRAFANA